VVEHAEIKASIKGQTAEEPVKPPITEKGKNEGHQFTPVLFQ
jgi:hypothetical protein